MCGVNDLSQQQQPSPQEGNTMAYRHTIIIAAVAALALIGTATADDASSWTYRGGIQSGYVIGAGTPAVPTGELFHTHSLTGSWGNGDTLELWTGIRDGATPQEIDVTYSKSRRWIAEDGSSFALTGAIGYFWVNPEDGKDIHIIAPKVVGKWTAPPAWWGKPFVAGEVQYVHPLGDPANAGWSPKITVGGSWSWYLLKVAGKNLYLEPSLQVRGDSQYNGGEMDFSLRPNATLRWQVGANTAITGWYTRYQPIAGNNKDPQDQFGVGISRNF